MAVKLGRSRYSEDAAQRRRDKAADLHDDDQPSEAVEPTTVESDSASTVTTTSESESESPVTEVPKQVRFMEPKSKARAGPVVLSLKGAEKEKSGHTKSKERGRCALSAGNRRKQTSSLRREKESLRSTDKDRGKQNQKMSSPREGERPKGKEPGPWSADQRRNVGKQNQNTRTRKVDEKSKGGLRSDHHRRKQQKTSSPRREGESSKLNRDHPPTTAAPVVDENRCDGYLSDAVQCEVCHQAVRGGESGMEQHRLWSVRHRTYQLHKNGDTWEDAKKKSKRQLRSQAAGSAQALPAESEAATDAKPSLAMQNRNGCLADFLVSQANLIRSMMSE